MVFSASMLSLLFPLAASLCWAQGAVSGYVVKVESAAVYLDAGEGQGARPGMAFTLYTEGEELKHPATGASLGRIENIVGTGEITEVHEKYSMGRLSAGQPAPEGAGLRYRLKTAAQAPAAAPAQPAGAPLRRSPALDIEAVDLAFGDVDGGANPELLLAGKDRVTAFSEEDFKPVCSFRDPATATQFLSLEAADLAGTGRAQVFVTLYNRLYERLETYVLACSSGTFEKTATLPFMVRRFQDGSSTSLGAQQLLDDSTFPFGPIRRLRWADGRYLMSQDKVKAPRVEWLYGFGVASSETGVFTYFLNPTDRIRLQFQKGSWTSPDSYGQTSSRLRWHERPLEFHPRSLAELGPSGLAGLYVLRNIPRFGFLSDSFGSYSAAELHYLRWNGLSLAPERKAELPGYASGLAEHPAANGRPAEAAVSIVAPNGQTSVWYFAK